MDTNVIVSALIFPGSVPARAFQIAAGEERLALTDWIIDELHEVIIRKWPDRIRNLDALLAGIQYDLLPSGEPGTALRDPNDQPILDAALAAEVDVIVTGDKDFLALGLDRPTADPDAAELSREQSCGTLADLEQQIMAVDVLGAGDDEPGDRA